MSTHLPGFQSFSGFLYHFVFAKLATSSIRAYLVWWFSGMDWLWYFVVSDDTVEGLHGSTKVLASPAAGATTTTATSSRGLSRSKTQLTSSSSTVPEGAGGRPSSPVNLSTNSRSPGAGIQGDQRTASGRTVWSINYIQKKVFGFTYQSC